MATAALLSTWRGRISRWWNSAPRSADDLLRLARDVEPEQPSLAAELRGFALHMESFERSRPPVHRGAAATTPPFSGSPR
jgi:hypothetical protein